MNMKKELTALRNEVETPNKKLAELTSKELEKAAGGMHHYVYNERTTGDITMKTLKRISAIVLMLIFVMTIFMSAMAASDYYTTGRCNMREGPGLNYDALQTIPSGVKLSMRDSAKDDRGVIWIKCSFEGLTGWVSSIYLNK